MREYEPSEDTFLLLKHLHCGNRTLDMGTGSGIIAIECAKKGSKVVAVDIDPIAVENLRIESKKEDLKIDTRLSNLFENVPEKFDTIIFNPPYLPGEAKDIVDYQWAGGGKYGDETILKFLRQAKKHINKGGEILIILSSFNRIEEIAKMGYGMKKIDELKLSFHKIYLFSLRL